MNEYDYSIDEVEEMLNEIAEKIPKVFYNNLHGGIVLLENIELHPDSIEGQNLYIEGTYLRSKNGNVISIYYGSIMESYGSSDKEILKNKLEEVLLHEFRHHIEYEAGDYSLVVEDKIFLKNYLERYSK